MKKSVFLAFAALVFALLAVPGQATAHGSLHIKAPVVNIAYHGHSQYRRGYRSNRYYRNNYRNNYQYRNNYRHSPRRYYKRYNNRYRYCSAPGYSTQYYDNRDCYRHNNHYHCDG